MDSFFKRSFFAYISSEKFALKKEAVYLAENHGLIEKSQCRPGDLVSPSNALASGWKKKRQSKKTWEKNSNVKYNFGPFIIVIIFFIVYACVFVVVFFPGHLMANFLHSLLLVFLAANFSDET